MTDDSKGWDGYACRYTLVGTPPERDLEEALQLAAAAVEPASPDLVVRELARLRLLTVSRESSAIDLDLLISVYVDELQRYPADLLVEVLRDWSRTQRFWPSLNELTDPLDRMMCPRRALLDALLKGPRTVAAPEPDRPPPGEDEKRAVRELLARHGIAGAPARRERPLEPGRPSAERMRAIDAELAARPVIPRPVIPLPVIPLPGMASAGAEDAP